MKKLSLIAAAVILMAGNAYAGCGDSISAHDVLNKQPAVRAGVPPAPVTGAGDTCASESNSTNCVPPKTH